MNSAESGESHFDRFLLAWDQRLAGETTESVDAGKLDAAEKTRLERAAECLELLQSLHESCLIPSIIHRPQLPERFQIIRSLGSGGFGEVLLAEDTTSGSQVAIKIPHAFAIQDYRDRQRFLREARVLSTIDHPAIIRVIESGEENGVPFLVMEYCDRGNLGQLLSDQAHRPSPEESAQIIHQIAEGLAILHQRGILHRDIKPRNILLRHGRTVPKQSDSTSASNESSSTTAGRVYDAVLTDFGLVKSLAGDSDSAKTRTGATAGTPQYMAPEQVAGLRDQIGPATDVHGLGIVLYELLTGQQPYLGDSPTETCWNILHQEPIPVRAIRPKVPRDLETICMKAIEKSPSRRYPDSKELAIELSRYLQGEPIHARPISWHEKVWKWGRQRPSLAMLVVVVVISLTVISCGGWWYSSQLSAALSRESKLAQSESSLRVAAEEKNLALTRQQSQLDDAIRRESLLAYTAQIRLAYDLRVQGQELESATILDQLAASNYRDFVWRNLVHQAGGRLTRLTGLNNASNYRSVSLIPEKHWILAGTGQGLISTFDSISLKPLPSPFPSLASNTLVYGFAYHASTGNWFYSFYPEDYKSQANGSQLIQYHEDSGKAETLNSSFCMRSLSVSRDRSKFALQSRFDPDRSGFDIYSMETGQRQWSVESESAVDRTIGWASDGRIAIPHMNEVQIYSPEGQRTETLSSRVEQEHYVFSARFSADDNTLAVLLSDMTVDLYRRTENRFEFLKKIRCDVSGPIKFEDYRYGWHGLEFRQGDQQLVVDGPEKRVFVIAPETGHEICRSPAFTDNVMTILDLPDRSLLLHEIEGSLFRWKMSPRRASLQGHDREAWTVEFSPDGRTIISGSDDGTVKLWSVSSGELIETLGPFDMTVVSCRFSPNGSRLAALLLDGTLKVWDFDSNNQRTRGTPAVVDAHRRGRCLAWSSDSQSLATGGYEGETVLHQATPLKALRTQKEHDKTVRQVRFIHQDRGLLSVSNDGKCLQRTLQPPGKSDLPVQEDSEIHSIVLLPDGDTVALGLRSGVVSLRRLSTGESLGVLVGHKERVRSLALSPDGKVLVSGDETGLLRFWRVENRQLMMSVQHGSTSINELAFSPTGDILAIATHDGRVALWHAP
jgi:serine/threonine protein kinase